MSKTALIANTIRDPFGVAVGFVPVTFTLMSGSAPTAGFRIDDGTEVAAQAQLISGQSGAYTQQLEQNANIAPAGTYWMATELKPALSGGPSMIPFLVGPNGGVLSQLQAIPVPAPGPSGALTQTQADLRYTQASQNFNLLYVTIAGAITAPVVSPVRIPFPVGCASIDGVTCVLGTAVGGLVVCDVLLGGSSLWFAGGTKPTFTVATSTASSTGEVVPFTQPQPAAAGAVLQCSVTNVSFPVPAADLTFCVRYH